MGRTENPIRLAKLVKATAEGKNQTEAGLLADPNRTPESARTWANETLQKPTVKEMLHKEMVKQGIDIASVVKPVKDGLVAEKVSIVGNGDQAMAEVTPDHSTRLKAVQIASKWMGIDAVNGEGTTNNFIQIINNKADKYAD